jgi:hypothetical protein
MFEVQEEDPHYRVWRVEQLLELVRSGVTEHGSPARAFAAIQALRAQADRYERDLIRSLRWDAEGSVVRTWAQVGELVDARLGSRQAAHQRWGRLKAPARGQTRRGRPPGRSASLQ